MNRDCGIELDFTQNVQIYDQYAGTNVEALVRKFMTHANTFIARPLITTACEVMMLRNATGAILDAYGKILNISRNLVITDRYERVHDQMPGITNLTQLPNQQYLLSLDDDAYRTLLLLKAQLYNVTSDGNSKMQLLSDILASRTVAFDGQDMTSVMHYFLDEIPLYLALVIEQYSLISSPAGVSLSFISAVFRYIGFKPDTESKLYSAFWKALFYPSSCESYITQKTPWYYLSDSMLTSSSSAQRNRDKTNYTEQKNAWDRAREVFTINSQQAIEYAQKIRKERDELKDWHAKNTELINSLSSHYRVTSHIPRIQDKVPSYLAPELPKPTIHNYKSVMYYLHHRALNFISNDSYEYDNLLYADEFYLNDNNHFYYTTDNWDNPNLVDYITDIMDTNVGKLVYNHLDKLPLSHTGDPKLQDQELMITINGGVILSSKVHPPFANYWTLYLDEKKINTPVDRYNIQAAAYYTASFRQWKAFIDYYDLKYMDSYRFFMTYQCVLESDIQKNTELIQEYQTDIVNMKSAGGNEEEIKYRQNQLASVEAEREVQKEVLSYYKKNLAYVQKQIEKVENVIRNMKTIYDNIASHLHQVHDKIDNAVYEELKNRFTVDLAAVKSEYDSRRGPYLQPKEHWVEKYNEIKAKHDREYQNFIRIHQNWVNYEDEETPYWHCYWAQQIIADIIHYDGDDYTSKYPYWHVCNCYHHFYNESMCQKHHDNRGHRGGSAYTNLNDLRHLYSRLRAESIKLIDKINEYKGLGEAEREMEAFYRVYDSPQGLDCYQQLQKWDDQKFFAIS